MCKQASYRKSQESNSDGGESGGLSLTSQHNLCLRTQKNYILLYSLTNLIVCQGSQYYQHQAPSFQTLLRGTGLVSNMSSGHHLVQHSVTESKHHHLLLWLSVSCSPVRLSELNNWTFSGSFPENHLVIFPAHI